MISINELKEYSENLMFKMDEEQYKTLQGEFEVFLNWMDYIGQIENLDKVKPMYFCYDKKDVELRGDKPVVSLSKEEILLNAKKTNNESVIVPKVVN